jgi:hypothetical protein
VVWFDSELGRVQSESTEWMDGWMAGLGMNEVTVGDREVERTKAKAKA